MIKKLTIEHFKGFYEPETVEFAAPNQSEMGSGLTIIVGPNNTGKTTVIESLLINTDKRFKETERHENNNPKIIIESTNGHECTFTNVQQGSVVNMSGENHEMRFELIPSRRFWNYQFTGEFDFNSLISQSLTSNIRNSEVFNLGPMLKKILKEEDLKEKFDSYLKKLMPHFTGWTIDTNDAGSDYIKYQTSKTYHQSNLLGDGVISLFRIVAHLIHDESSTFIIDEPELSLHPSAQKRLSKVISELSKDKQIVLCTHSPYFVNWLDFIRGAKINRLNKHNDEKCTVNQLDNSKNYTDFISTSIEEYQKPQLLDVAAKEILFTDRILFLEGQEDVGLIRKWLVENDKEMVFDIFGYGVGGEQNIKLFLEMARDLNLEKVAALYDNNSTSFDDDCNSYQNYKLLKIKTDDIRDKNSHKGIFDKDGNMKEEHKSDFEGTMQEIITYFQN